MKKYLIALFALLIVTQCNACPFCGCGGGNLYLGILPDYKTQFFSLHYSYAEYHTVLFNDTSQHSKNYYNTIELSYGVHITPKLQLLAFVPYRLNKQIDDDGTTTSNGLGDLNILAQYEVLNTTHYTAAHSLVQNQLWLGGGVKLPTGVFGLNVYDTTTTLADINAQLGTGSIDFMLNGLYSLRLGSFGVNINATYKINTAHQGVRFGDKLSSNAIAYYHFKTGKQSGISPTLGFGYEHVATSTLPEVMKVYVPYTNSETLTGSLGVEYSVKGVGFGINGQLPLQENYAGGQTQMKFKGMAHITFSL